MAVYVVPTLGEQLFITKPQTIIAYVLRFYITSPKSISNTNGQAISLVDTLSRYGHDAASVVGPIRQELGQEFLRIFPTATIDVEVVPDFLDAARYNLSITPNITIDGLVYSIDKTVQVNNGVLTLSNDTVSFPAITQ